MSEVLIKGMEMPETAGYCSKKIDPDTRRCIYTGKEFEETLSLLLNRRCADCPLVEVPTPHGRLIDKDKLRRELFWNFNGERIPFYDCDNFQTTITYRDLHSILSEQPTIIESERGET